MADYPEAMEDVMSQRSRQPYAQPPEVPPHEHGSLYKETDDHSSNINLKTLQEVQKLNLKLDAVILSSQNSQQIPISPVGNDQFTDLVSAYNDLKQQAEQRIAELQDVIQQQQSEIEVQKTANDSHKTKLANLQRIILRAGHKEAVPMDSDVQERFVTLKSDILQIVRLHFAKSVQPKDGYPRVASPEVPELYIRAKSAKQLYTYFFDPEILLFGLDDDRSGNLFKVVEGHILKKRGNTDDLREWRASSIRIIKTLSDGQKSNYSFQMADSVWKQIRVHCHHETRSAERDRAKEALETLCLRAYEIALFIRETKIEYMWEQDIESLPSLEIKPNDQDILGTMGPTPNEPHKIHWVVFGGVVRGDRHTGRLKDGRYRLTTTSVVIAEPS